MARMRNSSIGGDSLELLLDTICNMFGGIVFISLLVVLMVNNSGGVLNNEHPPISAEQLENLQIDLATSRVELARLAMAREQQIVLISKFIPEDLQQRLGNLKSSLEHRSALEMESQRLREENLSRLESINETRVKMEESKQTLDDLRNEVAKLEEQTEKKLMDSAVSLPRARQDTNEITLQVTVMYDRLYFHHDLQLLLSGERAPNSDDFLVIDIDDEYITVQPRRTTGIDLSNKQHASAQIMSKLRQFPNTQWTIGIVLWPDSYQSFRTLREILSENSYRYNTLAVTNHVMDRGGGKRLVQ